METSLIPVVVISSKTKQNVESLIAHASEDLAKPAEIAPAQGTRVGVGWNQTAPNQRKGHYQPGLYSVET